MKSLKIMSLVLLMVFLLAIISSCKTSNQKDRTVASTDPIFVATEKVIFLPDANVSLSQVSNIRQNGDVVLVNIQMMYEVDEETRNSSGYNPLDYIGEKSIVYSLSNNTVTAFDTADVFPDAISMCQSIAIRPDGMAEAMFLVFDESTYDMSAHWLLMNLSSGAAEKELFYPLPEDFPSGDMMAFEIDEKGNRYFCTEGVLVVYDSEGRLILNLKDPQISGFLLFADGKVALSKESEGNRLNYYIVDLERGNADEEAKDVQFGQVASQDGSKYSAVGETIVADESGEEIFSWLNSDADLSHYLKRSYYHVINPDTISAIGIVEEGNQCRVYGCSLIRAKENPYTGKNILYLGGMNLTSDMELMSAVYEYNLFSDNAYLKIKNYAYDEPVEGDESSQSHQQFLDIQKQLLSDVKNGNVDIVANMAHYNWYSDNDALMDLSQSLEGFINEQVYYENLIYAFREKDKLFQIPLSVSINGLVVGDDVGIGEVMNWEETADYFSKNVDVYSSLSRYPQHVWIDYLMAGSSQDIFSMSDKSLIVDREELANVICFSQENGKYSDTWSESSLIRTVSMGSDDPIVSIQNYADLINISYYQGRLLSLAGLPSLNNQGLGITSFSSVAVSSQCAKPEAAIDFVKLLLASEYQNKIASNNKGIPVKRDSVELQINNAIKMSESDAMFSYYYSTKPTDAYAARYREIIEAALQRNGYNPEIISIIHEESSIFFAGQKSVDDVITVIESRISTLFKEKFS